MTAADLQSDTIWKGGFAITKSDTVDLAEAARGIWVGTGGTLKVTCIDGSIVTYKVPDGAVLPQIVARVWATGTSAADMVGGR